MADFEFPGPMLAQKILQHRTRYANRVTAFEERLAAATAKQ